MRERPYAIEHQDSDGHQPASSRARGNPSRERHDVILSVQRSDLAPNVRSYADNLAAQIRNILAAHGIANIKQFTEQAMQKESPLSADLDRLERLTKLLNHIREKGELPLGALLVISVESETHDIQNPFADIWAENGIIGKEKLETLEIDLGEMLELQKATYRAKGLDAWADTLPANGSEIISSDPKQRERFESYLKEGKIPFFMPGASVQLATMKAMVSGDHLFSHFKPDITSTDEDGAPSTTEAENGYIHWNHFRNLMAREDTTLVAGVPERWYIMWLSPSQKPEALNTNLGHQKKYIKKGQEDFKKKHNTHKPLNGGIMPLEYCAAQTLLPAIAETYLKKMEHKDLQSFTPFDKNTYTRFPGVEEAGGDVAVAEWSAVSRRLELDGNSFGADSGVGVRFPVREEVGVEN